MRLIEKKLIIVSMITALCPIAVGTGCGVSVGSPPAGAFLGRAETYDYSPSAIQVGNLQQFWWCGFGNNPNQPSQTNDTIQYAEIDLTTQKKSVPITVLGETPDGWDSAYTCNPKVIMGTFNNPLGDGQNYSYAMYYVATALTAGIVNSIGVAFSSDGIHWKKYPAPIISATTQTNYGVGQPALYNSDHKAGIWMFYEDANESPTVGCTSNCTYQHIQATSTDGIHFTVVGKLTTNGLPRKASWGDMAYDSSARYWYAVFNDPIRDPSTTGNIRELGQIGITLYRIKADSLLTGTSSWEELKTFDTNLTGFESNFIAGFLRDQYGNLNVGPYPTIEIFSSISNPAPVWKASPARAGKSADIRYWDIGKVEWAPSNTPLMPLKRYANKVTQEVTTGWIDPNGGFTLESTLGQLYESPQNGASLALYGCKASDTDYFVSTDSACGGSRVLGLEGYGYALPVAGLTLVSLYSCRTVDGHFVSQNSKCEGEGIGTLLGYAVP
jgi:hypothetical protein